MRVLFLVMTITTLVSIANAQVDPSTLAIIKSSSTDEANEDASASNRYEVRPKKKKVEPVPREEDWTQGPETITPSPEPSARPLSEATTLPPVAPPSPSAPGTEGEDKSAIGDVRDLFLGGSPEALDGYRNYLPPDDIRQNLLEVTVAPFYVYNDSKSPFWYRNYQASAPGLGMAMDIWFTPLFGLDASYKRTLAGEVRNTVASDAVAALTQEWMTIGFRFRRFYGFSDRATSFTFGLDYSESQFRVPADDPGRIRLRNTGPRILMEARIPKTSRQTSLFGLEILAVPKHQETATNVTATSGSQTEGYGVGVSYGEEFKLARTNRVFWKVNLRTEKSIWNGGSSPADPVTGTTHTTVPVTNTFTFFELGIVWGK